MQRYPLQAVQFEHPDIVSLARDIVGIELPTDPSARLDACGFDSLAFAELAAALDERHGIRVPDIALPQTVGDLFALASRNGGAAGAHEIPSGLGRYQRIVRDLAAPIVRLFFDLRVEGVEHIPSRGPVIVCLNHDSALDVVVAVVAVPRPMAIMGKEEVFIGAPVARLFHELGAYPVGRDRWDRRALGVSLALLRAGHPVAVWPEGTRSAHDLLPFLPGAAWLALASGAPLAPGAIVGSGAAWPRDRLLPRPHPIRVVFSELMEVERVETPGERLRRAPALTIELRSRIERLLEEGSGFAR